MGKGKIFAVIAKVLKKVLLDKKIGLVHPKSITFVWFTLPFISTILSIYNPKLSSLANNYLGFDVKNPNIFKDNENRIEILSMYISYVLLIQIIYAPIVLGDRKRMPTKITDITRRDIPMILFRIISVMIIPRSVSLFLKNNVKFEEEGYSQVLGNLGYLTSNIGIVTLDNIWNPFSFIVSGILSLMTIKFNDADMKMPYLYFEKGKLKVGEIYYKQLIKNILGSPYPNFKNKADDMILASFLLCFWLVVASVVIKQIPVLQDYIVDDSFITMLTNIATFTMIPILFKNMSYGTKYASEMTTLGSLLGVVVSTIV